MQIRMNTCAAALGAAVLLAGLSLPAAAHDECEGCSKAATTTFSSSDWNLAWYVGAGLDYTQFKDWNISQADPDSFTSRDEDDNATGFRVTAGMEFLRFFAVEASYADLGEAKFSGQNDGTGPVFVAGPQRDAIELDGYSLQLVARVPVKDAWSIAGKAGWWQWQARQRVLIDFGGGPTSGGNSDTGIRFAWGAGLDYDGFKPLRIGLEYRAATFEAPFTADAFGTSDISSLGASVTYRF